MERLGVVASVSEFREQGEIEPAQPRLCIVPGTNFGTVSIDDLQRQHEYVVIRNA